MPGRKCTRPSFSHIIALYSRGFSTFSDFTCQIVGSCLKFTADLTFQKLSVITSSVCLVVTHLTTERHRASWTFIPRSKYELFLTKKLCWFHSWEKHSVTATCSPTLDSYSGHCKAITHYPPYLPNTHKGKLIQISIIPLTKWLPLAGCKELTPAFVNTGTLMHWVCKMPRTETCNLNFKQKQEYRLCFMGKKRVIREKNVTVLVYLMRSEQDNV